MKKSYIIIFLINICALLFSVTEIIAQNVEISAQIRPRFEYRHGYSTLTPEGAKAASFISQRTRLNLAYSSVKFKVGLSMQDVRVWGDVKQLNEADVNGTSIHQAWGEIIFNKIISLKVGRQEVVYDDQRIFGNVDWAQQGRSHDAAIIKISPTKSQKLDFGFAYNQGNSALFGNNYYLKNYKTFQYLWYHVNINKFSVSFLMLNNGIQYWDNKDTNDIKNKIAYSQTIGTRVTYESNKVFIDGSFYYQTGQVSPAPADTVSKTMNLGAYYFSVNVGYQFVSFFTAGLGFEYISGNSQIDPSTNRSEAFTPLYGTNHKFNGWMDYFYVGNFLNSVGLVDIYLPLRFVKNKVTVLLIPHYFQAANDIRDFNSADPKATMSKDLGVEIDMSIAYQFSKNASIKAGYSQMFATKSMDVIKDVPGGSGRTNNWAWVMINFTPTFFQSNK